jgi:aerobic-type carbon monoxide dehydrogenase small subunit (CoxS/CutS family)
MAQVTKLNVNGRPCTMDADARISLLSVLRDQLDRIVAELGAKRGLVLELVLENRTPA